MDEDLESAKERGWREIVERLLSYSDRLVIGVFNEERDARSLESEVAG